MASVTLRDLYRLERKLDLLLRLAGLTLHELAGLANDEADDAALAVLVEKLREKLRAHSAPLVAAVAANQPKQ